MAVETRITDVGDLREGEKHLDPDFKKILKKFRAHAGGDWFIQCAEMRDGPWWWRRRVERFLILKHLGGHDFQALSLVNTGKAAADTCTLADRECIIAYMVGYIAGRQAKK